MSIKKLIVMVAIYMRYSSDNQSYLSIEAQERAIKEYCKKNGYKIVARYVDEAKSGTNATKRDAFQQMIEDSKKGLFSAVIVHKLDRFSRNVYDSLISKATLSKNGVKLESVTEPLEDTPESRLLEGILTCINAYYSENLGREAMKGLKEVAYKGLSTASPALGYDVVDRKYVINDKEAKCVKKIFDMYLLDYSYQQIADTLNKLGYHTKKNLPFNKNSLRSILENERYTGVYIYNKARSKCCDGTRNSRASKDPSEIIRIPDAIPQIISEETFRLAQDKMRANQGKTGKYTSNRYYLLSGLITCGNCGRAFSGNTRKSGRNKKEYASYRCGNARNQCNVKEINIDYLNNFVLKKLKQIIFKESNYPTLLKLINKKVKKAKRENKNTIISLKNKLIQINGAIDKLTEELTNSNSKSVSEKILQKEKEKAKLERLLEKAENQTFDLYEIDDIPAIKKKFKKYLLKKDKPFCRAFIRSFVDKIVVTNDEIEVILKTE